MSTSKFQLITPKDLDLDDYNDRANEIAGASWPEFMLHDPVADNHWHNLFDPFGDSPRLSEARAQHKNGADNAFNWAIEGIQEPVRPSQKSQYPLISIDDYITWTNGEGLPFDAWLRVHARLGGKIVKPCRGAMLITGTTASWEEWTGLKFPQSGEYIISGALKPIEMNIEKDEGVYIEPNVWMQHSLA